MLRRRKAPTARVFEDFVETYNTGIRKKGIDMDQIERLLQNTSRTVTDVELQQLLQIQDYSHFHKEVEKLIEDGILVPVKSSKQNGRRPPLYNKYRIIKPEEDYSRYLEAIRRLNPVLSITSYLQKPDLYKKHQQILEGISRYLWVSQDLLNQPMSRKERSFSIWGQEKLLDKRMSLVKEVLRFNGLAEDFLNYYDTPEPFFEYFHDRREVKTILIIENKDTWFTLRKLMQETGENILAGTAIHVLLYGEGNKITKPRALEEYRAMMLGGVKEEVRFLYFGDLDWEGIRLFYRTREANGSLDIKPFSALYYLMIDLAKKSSEKNELPQSPDTRGVTGPLTEFLSDLEEGYGEPPWIFSGTFLSDLLAAGRYIPQEIINYQVVVDLLK